MAAEASRSWRFDPSAVLRDADVVVWGRLPDRSGAARVISAAARREFARHTVGARLPRPYRLVGAHPLLPRQLDGASLLGKLKAGVRAGLLIEISSLGPGRRVLDRVAEAAGVTGGLGPLHLGAGGSMVARGRLSCGSEAVLRVARSGGAGDPKALEAVLERLSTAGLQVVPRLHRRGCCAGASWLAETVLPGHRPGRLDRAMARQVADVLARLPRESGSPTSLDDDLRNIAERLPRFRKALEELWAAARSVLGRIPSVLRHGDLWAGNLLVERGTLTGVIDWDFAHRRGVPGADLLHLVATEMRRVSRWSLAEAFRRSPWRCDEFTDVSQRYWTTIGLQPDPDLLELAGVAWWAEVVAGTLARFPRMAADERWVSGSVHEVLEDVASRGLAGPVGGR